MADIKRHKDQLIETEGFKTDFRTSVNFTINKCLCPGANSENVDSLVFDTLIPKPMLQRYISLLKEHRRVILSGPSGTGKTYLANQLSQHLLQLEGRPSTPNAVVTFNVDHKSSKVQTHSVFVSVLKHSVL